MVRSDIQLFKRNRGSEAGRKPHWYYRIKDPETGKQGKNQFSVDALAKQLGMEQSTIATKPEAEFILGQAVALGVLKYPEQKLTDPHKIKFIDFVQEICTYESSPWIASEAKRRGKPHDPKYIENIYRAFTLHAAPCLKRDMKLSEFKKRNVAILQQKMVKNKVSPDNINNAFKAINAAFKYAESMDIVEYNPAESFKAFIVNRPEKEIFTRDESKQILNVLEKYSNEAMGREITYLAVKLALYSGMREGEIRSFTLSRLSRIKNREGNDTEYYSINIDTSWNDTAKEAGLPKGNYGRTSVIHKSLADEIIDFAHRTNKKDTDFVFAMTNKGVPATRPISKSTLEKYLYEAMDEIGITTAIKQERHLDFHALRHFYETEMKDQMKYQDSLKEIIRNAIGHKSKSVDELIYTHDTVAGYIWLGVLSQHLLEPIDTSYAEGNDND